MNPDNTPIVRTGRAADPDDPNPAAAHLANITGFPSTAADHAEPPLSLDRLCNLSSPSVFPCRFGQNILIVDRDRDPVDGSLVIADVGTSRMVVRVRVRDGVVSAVNLLGEPLDPFKAFEVWGTVLWSVRNMEPVQVRRAEEI